MLASNDNGVDTEYLAPDTDVLPFSHRVGVPTSLLRRAERLRAVVYAEVLIPAPVASFDLSAVPTLSDLDRGVGAPLRLELGWAVVGLVGRSDSSDMRFDAVALAREQQGHGRFRGDLTLLDEHGTPNYSDDSSTEFYGAASPEVSKLTFRTGLGTHTKARTGLFRARLELRATSKPVVIPMSEAVWPPGEVESAG